MKKIVRIVVLFGLLACVAACALQSKPQANVNPDLVVDAPDIGPGTTAAAVTPAPECPACTQTFQVELAVIEVYDFITGKYDIVPSMATDLDRAAEILRANPGAKCVIYGHADLQGEPDYDNVVLARNRGNAVKEALIQRGVKPEQITVCDGLGAMNRFGPGNQPRNRGAIIVIGYPANGSPVTTVTPPVTTPRQLPGGVSPFDPTVGEGLNPVLLKRGETIYFNIVFINALLESLKGTYPNISLSNISVSAAYDGNQWKPRRGQDQLQIDANVGAVVPSSLYGKRFTVVIFPPGQNDQFVWTMYYNDGGCYIHDNNHRIGESYGLSIDIGQCPRR